MLGRPLGIAGSCLHRWRRRDLVDRGLRPGATAQEGAELAAARQRVRDLEEEVKILRKGRGRGGGGGGPRRPLPDGRRVAR